MKYSTLILNKGLLFKGMSKYVLTKELMKDERFLLEKKYDTLRSIVNVTNGYYDLFGLLNDDVERLYKKRLTRLERRLEFINRKLHKL